MKALEAMVETTGNMNSKNPNSVKSMIEAINSVQTGKLNAIINKISSFNYVP